ncbi:hypothetical protein APSETT444_009983 [Aspergillus pseudonomiae]
MIGATRRWFRRNRKGLAIGAGVIGAGYLAGQYVLSKISEARERMSSDRIARENLRRRFEQNQTDCTYTVLALLPTAAEDIVDALPVEELTKELQRKRAERLARLSAGEGTGSDLSSVSPSLPEDDRRSLSSFQSDGFVRTSQMGEPSVEGDGEARPKRNKTQLWNEVKITWEDKLLEESGVLGVTELANSQTATTLRHLLDETADLIESPTFTRVLMLLNNECFQTLIQQCTADAFKSTSQPSTSVPQSFTSVATVVPGADSSEPKAKLANVLAVLARQAHVIGNGTNPPNIYLTAMDQGVRELEAFAAVVYSSNFDFELVGSGTKIESPGDETPGSDTVLIEKEDYDELNRSQIQQPSTTGPGANSAFEHAWGKAVEEQPSTAT